METPPKTAQLWRFLSLEKFLNLISTSELHLSRLDSFRDQWEGHWHTPILESARRNWPGDAVEQLSCSTNMIRKSFFASCWYENDYESAALWSLYSGKAGFAIRTTVDAMKESLVGDPKQQYIGRVKYYDYATEADRNLNMFVPVFSKRKSFEHECEVRMVTPCWTHEGIRAAAKCKVDLKQLLEHVFVSPESEDWILQTVGDVMKKYGLQGVPLSRSTLYDPVVQ